MGSHVAPERISSSVTLASGPETARRIAMAVATRRSATELMRQNADIYIEIARRTRYFQYAADRSLNSQNLPSLAASTGRSTGGYLLRLEESCALTRRLIEVDNPHKAPKCAESSPGSHRPLGSFYYFMMAWNTLFKLNIL